ncbi:hypothetical protein L2E82_03881 [Cichorium intybus]|uniref:Uncharacterized protein n=1 Tax=Cichorium intybus TaxID=13427 RepID=A0ACB9H4K0_CICIN|nr:hypothetical protein L2E82_03881 [Cichorium intybus]
MNKYEWQEASKHEDGVDLISSLPDPSLVLILSGLPSTEESIRTSILSRRWRSVDLDSFRLSSLDDYNMSTVEQWIRATVMRNVKQLDLSFSLKANSEDMVMPHCLVTCASLELNFLYQCIDAAHDLTLPNLKTLELFTINAGYTVETLNTVLKICPKLESLSFTIENVYTYERDSEQYDETEYPKLDETETGSILTPNVKWVESFEFNGEKPKVDIDWYKNKKDWEYIHAKWGNNAK